METTTQPFLSSKHSRLLTFATIADVLAWIFFFIQVIDFILRFISLQKSLNLFGIQIDYLKLTSDYLGLAKIFLMGMIYWALLKGVALALRMIVETDINYRENRIGGANG